jgi:hypothetical protein
MNGKLCCEIKQRLPIRPSVQMTCTKGRKRFSIYRKPESMIERFCAAAKSDAINEDVAPAKLPCALLALMEHFREENRAQRKTSPFAASLMLQLISHDHHRRWQ